MAFQGKILLIEEEKKLVNNLTPRLEQEGFVVLRAENNFEALKFMNNKDCDLQLILAPLSINENDNVALLSKAKKIEKTEYNTLPVIFLSQGKGFENLFGLSNYGYCDYIKEPYDFNELMLKIKTESDKFD